jgi:hypothetical protein
MTKGIEFAVWAPAFAGEHNGKFHPKAARRRRRPPVDIGRWWNSHGPDTLLRQLRHR